MMAENNTDTSKIPVLRDADFRFWNMRLNTLLEAKELKICLDENETQANSEKWKKADCLTRSIILNSLTTKQMIIVEKSKTAKQMIKALETNFSGIHERYQCKWILEIINNKLNAKENCSDHISRILMLYSNIEASGMEMKDNLKRSLLYASLGSQFRNFIEINQEIEGQSFEHLLSKLRSACIEPERQRSQAYLSQESNGSNYFSHERGRRGRPQAPPRVKIICHFCGKAGHKTESCWRRNEPPSFKRASPNRERNANSRVQANEKMQKGNQMHKGLLAKEICYSASDENPEKDAIWIIDSGCSSHFTNNENFFKELHSYDGMIQTANGQTTEIKGKGHGILNCIVENDVKENMINELLFIPQAVCNMISVSTLDKRGFAVHFEEGKCTISRNKEIFAEAHMKNNVYKLSLLTESSNLAMAKKKEKCSIQVWHRRLGHRQNKAIKELQEKGLAHGIEIAEEPVGKPERCECCLLQKGQRPSFPINTYKRSTKVLDLIHTDLCGPINIPSLGQNKYILIFVDDHSRYTTTYLLREKRDVGEMLMKYVNMVSNKFEGRPKILQSDNGGEFVSREIESYLESKGIVHHTTVAYTPEQNSVAERKFRSIMEMTRCLLAEAKLPKKMWGEAVQTSVYLQNRLPTKGASCTPFELWHGGKPNLSHIRTFGSVAYTHVPKQRRNKLDSTAQKGILVGYSPGNKGYRVLDINTGIVNVRHVIHFEENERIRDSSKIPNIHCEAELENQPLINLPTLNDIPEPVRELPMIIPTENPPELNNKQEQSEANFNEQQSNLEELDTSNRAEQPVIRQSDRSNKGIPPKRLSYLMNSVQAQEPKSWNDIKNLPPAESAKWYKATNEEIESLNQNKTWILTELPPGKNLIDCKWVFKIKKDSYGKVERYKARLVAKGFSQKYGEDFDEVFAPVVKHTTIRTLLTIAASRKMLVKHVDVKTAFLHGNITEDIYMKQPPGFVDPKHKHLVCKLQKGLYGLRQGAKCWNEALDKILKEMNFNQGKEDQCLYMRCKNGQFSYILTFVDDLLICCSTENEYKEIAAHLTKRVEIKELGDVSSYLGMQIKREKDGSFLLSQSQKILELLEILGMTDSHPSQTPMMTDFLKREDQTEYLANNTQYREAIGKLLYICTSCRPDISNAVSILSRRVNAPTESDWGAVKRIVRYLKGTIDYKLRLAACDNPKLTCYTDSDWGGDPSNYRSTSGYCFMYGNAPIAWASIKQNLVSLSSTESEFYAASEAGRELCWLDRLLSDFGRAESRPIVMYEDNQSCIRLVQNEKIACRTKHIGVRVYRLKELSDEGTIELVYCPTDQMTADMLTKPLPRESFEKLRGKIGLIA